MYSSILVLYENCQIPTWFWIKRNIFEQKDVQRKIEDKQERGEIEKIEMKNDYSTPLSELM